MTPHRRDAVDASARGSTRELWRFRGGFTLSRRAGILNVSAVEKSTGKEQKITIKNDKGRLSQDEIDRMVDEAERYKAEDEANRVRVEAKNSLENYCYSMKNTMGDEKLASKLSDDDKSTVTAKIDETTSWLDANQMAEKEEYEAKQKELEAVVNPILAALGGGAGGGGMPGGMPGGTYAASVSELSELQGRVDGAMGPSDHEKLSLRSVA